MRFPIKNKWLRLAALAALVLLAWGIGVGSGITDHLNKDDLRGLVDDAGRWGIVLFLALYCFGLFIYVPGIIYVAGAVLLYGWGWGILIAYFGGLLAISTSFVVNRKIGGAPLVRVKGPRLRAVLSRLHQRPVRVIALVRVLTLTSPAVNTVLALSGVRYRDYVGGSAIGLLFSVTATATLFHYALW